MLVVTVTCNLQANLLLSTVIKIILSVAHSNPPETSIKLLLKKSIHSVLLITLFIAT